MNFNLKKEIFKAQITVNYYLLTPIIIQFYFIKNLFIILVR